MKLQTLLKLEKSSYCGGSFTPALLQLQLSFPSKEISNDEYQLEHESIFFHEFIHFLQAIGSTYNLNTHFEVMGYISQFINEVGGDTSRVLHTFSPFVDLKEGFREHFHYHYRSLDGMYGSRPFQLNMHDPLVGFVRLNEETLCYEYVRWNSHDQRYFATPLGAHTFQECMAFILGESMRVAENENISLPLQFNVPSNSILHCYNAPLELFWNTFPEKQNVPNDLIATLVTVLDMSLQIPSSHYENHPAWNAMTSPSFRFAYFLDAIKKQGIKLVNHLDEADYLRFINEVSDVLKWPSPLTTWEKFLEIISGCVKEWRGFVTSSIKTNPERFNVYVDTYLKIVRRRAISTSNKELSQEVIEEKATQLRNALISDPLSYAGIFGLGILDYIERALRLRVEKPTMLISRRYYEQLVQTFPIPFWVNEQFLTPMEPDLFSIAFYGDLLALPHLWALTRQWDDGKRKQLVCGYKYFGIPCFEASLISGQCPKWSPDTSEPDVECTFTDIVGYFHLWNEGRV